MDVIAGRKTAGKASGEILINGQPQNMRTFCRISGYVEQTDIHMPTATVSIFEYHCALM
jgi:ABC-type multidrug transport system ATPase subunit